MPAMALTWTALPTTKNVSSCRPLNRPRYAKNRIWKSGEPSIVVTYSSGVIQLKSARYEKTPPRKNSRTVFTSARAARAGEPLEVAHRERAGGEVQRRQQQAHRDLRQRVAAERGLADGAHPPRRREQPADRHDPAGQQGDRHQQPADEPDGVLEQVRERARVPVQHERR